MTTQLERATRMNTRNDQRCRVPARLLPGSADGKSLLGRIRVACPLQETERTCLECTSCERFIGWEFSMATREGWVTCRLPCTCCGSRRDVTVDIPDVVFCEDCRERASAVQDDDELGAGD